MTYCHRYLNHVKFNYLTKICNLKSSGGRNIKKLFLLYVFLTVSINRTGFHMPRVGYYTGLLYLGICTVDMCKGF